MTPITPHAIDNRQMLASTADALIPPPAVRTLLWVVLAAFAGLTAEVLWQFGYMGFAGWAFHNLATTLLSVDLVIALTMVIVVMWQDAARQGRTVWPYVLLTVAFGSAGPLLYFALHLMKRGR